MSGFDGNGWKAPASVSAEDRNKAINLMLNAALEAGNARALDVQVDALIAAGWGPGGVSARPTREALAIVLLGYDPADLSPAGREMHGPDYEAALRKADALLAADHLWTEQPSDPRTFAHIECDCVPDLGPSHCHLCGDRAGHPVPWAEAHPSAPVVDREALAEAIFDADPDNDSVLWDAAKVSPHDTVREWVAKARRMSHRLVASGLFVDRSVVEAEAIERYVREAIRAGGVS